MNKLARSITKWTKANDKRLNQLISYIHHTCEYRQYCHVGNTAKQCRLGLFQDSDFAGDLEDSKSTSGGTLCIFGSHTFVPISWMCKKQTAVSHSSTESEIISLDTGLRLDGLPALELWDLIVSVVGSVSQISDRTGRPVDVKRNQKSQGKINVTENTDSVPSNVQSSRQEAVMADFGQNRLWPKPTLANPTLAKPTLANCVTWVLVSRFQSGGSCVGVGFKVWFGPPFPGPPFPGPPFPWTALPLDRPKFRSFFSLSRRKIRSFLSLSGCLLVEFWWCF